MSNEIMTKLNGKYKKQIRKVVGTTKSFVLLLRSQKSLCVDLKSRAVCTMKCTWVLWSLFELKDNLSDLEWPEVPFPGVRGGGGGGESNKVIIYLPSTGELGTSLLHEVVLCTWLQSSSVFCHEQSLPPWHLPPRDCFCDHGGASYIHHYQECHHYQLKRSSRCLPITCKKTSSTSNTFSVTAMI